ncbi:endolytic transglycosylase MltG [Alkalihalobacillus sp. BA299]|uniref:endolytic transglycosylase MltG n=1 Tax=Alkalihalobacillus sp. BA299 TaxID=2815938 RepID=UPI001ADA19BE|nr:endolytic transglycosylase MltG [Alkalihalobacillus sp. BA299]
MDKHTARGLSIGFFITGIVLLLFKSVLAPAHITAEEPVLTQETIEVFLKENNLLVISEEDYETLKNGQVEAVATEEKPAEEKKDESKADDQVVEEKEEVKEEKTEEDKPVTHKIKISSGMVSPDVAKILKEKGLIQDESEFVRLVESKNAAKYIQIGEHELTTDMSMDEIISVITKGRA